MKAKTPLPIFHLEYHIITLFPEFFDSPLKASLVGKGFSEGILEAHFYDIRQYGIGRHKQVDDRPFGGGAGMILRPEPLFAAIKDAKKKAPRRSPVLYFTPRGRKLTQKQVERFAQHEGLILLCGRYEGIDQRVVDKLVDYEVCMGEYVLSGGEVAAVPDQVRGGRDLIGLQSVTGVLPRLVKRVLDEAGADKNPS